MNFPEKIVIDLKKWPNQSIKLVSVLKDISESSYCLENVDVGNDLKYCINEIPTFYSKLSELVTGIANKQGKDILGNSFNRFNRYKFAELIFSRDFKTITSIRLLGKRRRTRSGSSQESVSKSVSIDDFIRYIEFNVNNIFDPNIIYLIYRTDEIISKFFFNGSFLFPSLTAPDIGILSDSGPVNKLLDVTNVIASAVTGGLNKNSFTSFLDTYILPEASFHKKEVRPIECLLDDISSQISTLLPIQTGFEFSVEWQQAQKFDTVLKELNVYRNTNFSVQAFNQAKNAFDSTSPINQILKDGQIILEQIKTIDNPEEALDYVKSQIFNKINICYIIENLLKCLPNVAIEWLKTAPITEIFNRFDRWKNPGVEAFYNFINENPLNPFNQRGFLGKVEIFLLSQEILKNKGVCIDGLADRFSNLKFSDILTILKSEFPEFFDGIQSIFEENFTRDFLIEILERFVNLLDLVSICNFQLPSIGFPMIRFRGLYDGFALSIEELILSLLLGALSELAKVLLNLLMNLCFLPQFIVDIMMGFGFFEGTRQPQDRWTDFIRSVIDMLSKSNNLNMDFTSINDPQLLNIINNFETEPQYRPQPPQEQEECAPGDVQTPEQEAVSNSKDLEAELNNISGYIYCLGKNSFTTFGTEEDKSIQTLRAISEMVKMKEEREEQIRYFSSFDQLELNQRLFKMIQQIQSVLSPREVSMLVMGRYNDTVAQIVRMICKINFPSLSDKIDPIKYFIMIGKILGGIPNIATVTGE